MKTTEVELTEDEVALINLCVSLNWDTLFEDAKIIAGRLLSKINEDND